MPPRTPTPPHCADLPPLPTLDLPPSWGNARGHIDRSACIEIRVSEARDLAGCVPHKHRKVASQWAAGVAGMRERPQTGFQAKPCLVERGQSNRIAGATSRAPSVLPLPHEKPARNGRGRIATGILTITAHQLHRLHESRPPRMLAGDFRTARANAMRPAHWRQGRHGGHFRCRIDRKHPIAWPADRNLDGNPNKGATREKIIGLPREWTQPLRMEIWQFPKRIRPAYYFVCPSHATSSPQVPKFTSPQVHRARHRNGEHVDLLTCGRVDLSAQADPRLPPLSTRKPGRKHPSDKSGGGCPQRCLKLMMVQCTADERRDARIAQTWIDSIPPQMRAKMQRHINRLIERYGLIFEPRALLCPRCVGGSEGGGVHYGNNPETIRQGWRRRNNKPDTTLAAPGALLNAPVHMNFLARQEYEHQRERRAHAEAGGDAAIAAAHPVIAAERAERRKQWRRAYYRKNAKRINRQTIERRRRKRQASRGVSPR